MKDELGKRLKRDYENAFQFRLPRRCYVVLRIDGRAFHTFTRDLERPYSRPLANALDAAALQLCQEMIGCQFAYGQSDEYSFLLTDLDSGAKRDPKDISVWFDGNVQKIVSVSASIFTAGFNSAFAGIRPAVFDARLMIISQPAEVESYFLWRQADASANSLNMLASAYFSHEVLLGKSSSEKHELLHRCGVNWANQPADFKRGRAVHHFPDKVWVVDREIPIFSREASYLRERIPSVRQSA